MSLPVRRMSQSFSCPCGKVCRSKQGYAVHQAAMHGRISPVRWYARGDGWCEACGMVFSNRALLCNHLRSGSPLCLLSLLLRVPHFTAKEEAEHTALALDVSRENRKKGKVACAAMEPAFRRPWVPWKFYDLRGEHVPLDCRMHPCRNGRVQYGWR